jgi:hypothetical protein
LPNIRVSQLAPVALAFYNGRVDDAWNAMHLDIQSVDPVAEGGGAEAVWCVGDALVVRLCPTGLLSYCHFFDKRCTMQLGGTYVGDIGYE